MAINATQLKQYQQQGYVLVRGLIPPALCQKVRSRLDEVIAREPGWPEQHFQRIDVTRYARADGSGLPGGVQRPSKVDPGFEAIASHPNLAGAMATLLGGAVVPFTDQALIKYGRVTEAQGGRSYYHQDAHYWKLAPHQGCNCWLPLDPVGGDAICLAIIPGSQRSDQLETHESYYDDPSLCDRTGTKFKRHRIPADRLGKADVPQEVVIPMEPGDGLFFTNYTWHRSEPNRTGRDLMAYAVAYQLQ